MLIEQVSLGKVVRRACSEGYACATQLGVLYGKLAEPEAENEYSTYALHVHHGEPPTQANGLSIVEPDEVILAKMQNNPRPEFGDGNLAETRLRKSVWN